ncbi:trypsin-like serine peptidase [Spirosoma jeollabukense]
MQVAGEHDPVSNRPDLLKGVQKPAEAIPYTNGKVPEASPVNEAFIKLKHFTNRNILGRTRDIVNLPEGKPVEHIDALLNPPTPEIACGPNHRDEVDPISYPYRMVCLLLIYLTNDSEPFRGTGFFISPRCIITAGHCVYTNAGWVQKIEVIPGGRGNEIPPFGSQISTWFNTTTGWKESRDQQGDYGAIILKNDELYNNIQKCFFGYKIVLDNDPTIKKLFVAGYPEDKPQTQWKGEGPVESYQPDKLTYKIDTEKGNSGSPVFISDNQIYFALGIHNYGECPNFCTRITQSVINNFEFWKSLPDATIT